MIACIALLAAAAPAPPTSPPANQVQRVPPEQALAVLGHIVVDRNGKEIGRLVDVLVGAGGQPEAAVIDFGGFLGVGNRKIAIEWGALHFSPGDTKNPIMLEWTPDQIKAAPEYTNVAKPAPVVVAPPTHASSVVDPVPSASQ